MELFLSDSGRVCMHLGTSVCDTVCFIDCAKHAWHFCFGALVYFLRNPIRRKLVNAKRLLCGFVFVQKQKMLEQLWKKGPITNLGLSEGYWDLAIETISMKTIVSGQLGVLKLVSHSGVTLLFYLAGGMMLIPRAGTPLRWCSSRYTDAHSSDRRPYIRLPFGRFSGFWCF